MKPSYRSGIITGFAVGIFAIGCFSFFNWLNTKNGWGIQPGTIRGISGLITILIQGIGIYFSMQGTKTVQNGRLGYGGAFKAGFTVAVLTALITAFCGFIYCTLINPGYADYMVNEAHKAMLAGGESTKQIAHDMVGVRWEFSTSGQVTAALIAQSVVGTIISLIMAIFIRSKNS
jgi:hypothetical protein